jgi:hypothetical protein
MLIREYEVYVLSALLRDSYDYFFVVPSGTLTFSG